VKPFAVAFALVAAATVLAGEPARAADPPPTYAYDTYAPLDLNIGGTDEQGNVRISSITYRAEGQIVRALLVEPVDPPGAMPGVLFAADAADTQGLDESVLLEDAKWLARRGAASLLPEVPWAEPGWIHDEAASRTVARDIVANVILLRRSLDMLSGIDGVDKTHLAIVGQGLGATFAALATGVDERPFAVVFAAPDPALSKRIEAGASPAATSALDAALAPFDVRSALARSTFGMTLLQFARRDRTVTRAQDDAFADAIPGSRKTIDYYNTGHALDDDLVADERRTWLASNVLHR
jgi:dienelactone hydrolase